MKYVFSNKEYHSGYREIPFLLSNAIVEAQEILNNNSNNNSKNNSNNNLNQEINIPMYQIDNTIENTDKLNMKKCIQIPISSYSGNLPGVSVVNYISNDLEDVKNIKHTTSKRIKFMMSENYIYHFKYQNYSFTAEVYTLGNEPINDTREFYKELSINSDAPYHIIEDLASLAEE